MLRLSVTTVFLCLISISLAGFAQDEKPKPDAKPKPYDGAQTSFAEMVAETRDYKPGDLITWEDVKPYIDQLKENGVAVPDEKELSSKLLPKSDRLVKMLSSRQGTKFMRDLTKSGGSFDVLDRFRKIPRGYNMLQTMIDTPKGHQLLSDLSTTKTGKGTAQQLSQTPDGKDITKPTGLIYTEEALMQFLKTSEKKPAPEESPKPSSDESPKPSQP